MAQVVPPPALVARGHYVPATVVGPVGPHDPVAQDEWFGPVLAVIPAQDLDEALAIANGTAYALTGGCYARSPAVLERVSREFRVGNLYLNRGITGALVHRQPFGGFRGSGIGSKAGGPEYLHQFAVPRVICEHTLRHGMVDGGG
jgi:RHH-type proline utilization regulon transcriptional repressor/proline dehydrogenase/delta 1-pyrroline-5-carboxylate dehydrogenase